MARKEQRDRDKESKKRSFMRQKTGRQTEPAAVTTKASKKQAESTSRRPSISSGKKPWSRLIVLRPGVTHPNQANASARKQYQRASRQGRSE